MAQQLPAFSDTEKVAPLSDEEIRERIDMAIAAHVVDLVKGRTTLRVGRELGRTVYEGVTEIVFRVAVEHGYVRFPQGHGSLRVQRLKRSVRPKRLPTGQIVEMAANRVRLRYEEGAAVREALGMPRKTNYVRQYNRQSVLGARATQVLATGSYD